MFHLYFQSEPIESAFDVHEKLKFVEREFYLHLLGHGVIIPGVHLAFLCDAHTDDEVD